MTTDKDPRTLPLYLQEHLENIACNEGFIDYTMDQTGGSDHGDGFMSAILRITLTGNRTVDGLLKLDQLSLICKVLPSNMARRAQFNSTMLFKREKYFYDTVVPILTAFQQSKDLSKDDGFYTVPKCYVADCDEDIDHFVIILEDLRIQNFKLCNGKDNPFSYENVKLLLTALGRLHGLSFALRDQQPDVFGKLQAYLRDDIFLHIVKSETASKVATATYDLAIESLEAGGAGVDVRTLEVVRATFMDVFSETLRAHGSEPFAVIGQGDCWNNNIMFRNDENNSAQDIRILDWQMTRLQSPALDLSLFILTTVMPTLRRKYMDEFLEIYYGALREIILKCGSTPEKLFTFNDLQNQLRLFGKYGVAMMPIMLQFIISDADNIVDMDEFAANIDADSKTAQLEMIQINDQSRVEYRNRLSSAVQDAIKYGWISAENIFDKKTL